MGIIINTETITVSIDGTDVLFMGDPSGGQAWGELLDLKTSYSNAKERDELTKNILDSLTRMCVDTESADLLRGLFEPGQPRGIATLKNVVTLYIEEVTAFPTKPSAPSKKR